MRGMFRGMSVPPLGQRIRSSWGEPTAAEVVTQAAALRGMDVGSYAAETARVAREAFDARNAVVAPVVGDIALPVAHPVVAEAQALQLVAIHAA